MLIKYPIYYTDWLYLKIFRSINGPDTQHVKANFILLFKKNYLK